jgi:L-histidine N-alpha-methyltransferase
MKKILSIGETAAARGSLAREGFLRDVIGGLTSRPKSLPSRYFYDAAGSRLFEDIMGLPEYYPTRCEAEILAAAKEDILAVADDGPFYLVDLGSGNGEKTRILLERFLSSGELLSYVPIDISGAALRDLEADLRGRLPSLRVTPSEGNYLSALERFRPLRPGRKLALFLGGNIGNFDRLEAARFLQDLSDRLDEGDLLLIGFDLRKDPDVIRRAYDDSAGVTARFNLNLLERINRELEGGFHLETFRHQPMYDVTKGVARSYLISLHTQDVKVGRAGRSFHFEEGESIHTEDSFKYSREEIERLARVAGYAVEAHFTDGAGYFLDSLWRVKPRREEDWRFKP